MKLIDRLRIASLRYALTATTASSIAPSLVLAERPSSFNKL